MSDAATPLATVRQLPAAGMVTLRGDLASDEVKRAVKSGAWTEVPAPRSILAGKDRSVAWMSPDELLILVPPGEARATVQAMTKALGKTHSLVVDVSDARALIEVEGASAREVLAKLAPVDLHPDSFGPGKFRRTHLGQVPAAFWMTGPQTFRVICFRSVAAYVIDLLTNAAGEGGRIGLW